jgi:hypothetical protein
MMRTRAEAATAAGAMRDRNNNQPPSPAIYPDSPAPVVLTGEDDPPVRPGSRKRNGCSLYLKSSGEEALIPKRT